MTQADSEFPFVLSLSKHERRSSFDKLRANRWMFSLERKIKYGI